MIIIYRTAFNGHGAAVQVQTTALKVAVVAADRAVGDGDVAVVEVRAAAIASVSLPLMVVLFWMTISVA